MKNQIRVVVLAALFILGDSKIALPMSAFWALGVGRNSCGHWMNSPGEEGQTQIWIMGFWSGLNLANNVIKNEAGSVGNTTDADGIIEEVRKVCTEQPSTGIANAIYQVYEQFLSTGK